MAAGLIITFEANSLWSMTPQTRPSPRQRILPQPSMSKPYRSDRGPPRGRNRFRIQKGRRVYRSPLREPDASATDGIAPGYQVYRIEGIHVGIYRKIHATWARWIGYVKQQKTQWTV